MQKYISIFTLDELKKLYRNGMIFSINRDNDKRIANALHEILQVVTPHFVKASTPAEHKRIGKQLKMAIILNVEELYNELIIACLNTAQYDRGLEICDTFEKCHLENNYSLTLDRADFYAHLGQTEKGEQMLRLLLEEHANDPWVYIKLGDIYWQSQVQSENVDYAKAEYWYYQAYDRGLWKNQDIDGADDLLERLGSVCVEKLRASAQNNWLAFMEQHKIGDWRTIMSLKE